jgi:hypothetical protein
MKPMPPQYCRQASATSRSQAPGLELGHRRQLRDVDAGDVVLDAAPGQRAQRLDLGLQLGQAEVDDLVVDQRLPERLRSLQ